MTVPTPPPPLYIWLDTDPLAGPADASIPDTPGVADLELVVQAILAGHLGRFLPAKLAMSQHERPNPGGYRSVDVGRLLRDRRIPHRQRFELLIEP